MDIPGQFTKRGGIEYLPGKPLRLLEGSLGTTPCYPLQKTLLLFTLGVCHLSCCCDKTAENSTKGFKKRVVSAHTTRVQPMVVGKAWR